MISSLLLLIIIYAILFSLIFWVLTFIAKWFYSNKYFNYKLNYYECGFKSLTNYTISFNLNFILLILFLLIYDGEFLILIPFSLNTNLVSFSAILILSIFFFWLIFSLLIDFAFSALDWQV